jgi:secondary thiamine-phosphate synthase enzyme
MDTATQAGITLATPGRGFHEITDKVAAIVESSSCRTGVVQVFVSHTSCSLLITENADPAVRRDLERWMARAVPDGDALFEHDAEGPDDMPAHVRATLTGVSVCMPVSEGRLQLGTWQGIYLWEHRQAPHRRRITVTVLGQERGP